MVWGKQERAPIPVGAGVFRGKDRWGPVMLWAHRVGFSKALVTCMALLALKTRGKKKQQLFPWVLQGAIRRPYPVSFPYKNHLKRVLQKTVHLIPSSKIVNKLLSFFLLVCEFNLPSQKKNL